MFFEVGFKVFDVNVFFVFFVFVELLEDVVLIGEGVVFYVVYECGVEIFINVFLDEFFVIFNDFKVVLDYVVVYISESGFEVVVCEDKVVVFDVENFVVWNSYDVNFIDVFFL